ncbi:MAG: DUF4097 family beta strand repeat-containing protein [Gemmatimonadales bacterium]
MRLLSFLTVLFLPAAVLAAQTERYTLDGDDVAIYNLAGQLQVEAGQGTVAVQMTRGGAEAARLKVVQDEVSGRRSLRVIYPGDRVYFAGDDGRSSTEIRVRDDGTFGDGDEWEHHRGWHDSRDARKVIIGSRPGGVDAHADLRVQVPPGHRVSLYLAVGKVTVANVSGELLVDAASAPVTVTGFKGTLGIDVGSGMVRATQVDGDLSIDTGSGSVEISRVNGKTLSVDTGSGDVTGSDLQGGELSIDTGSGEIRLSVVRSPKISLETGSGAITADLREDVGSLDVETGSGDIAITAPPTLGAEVEIETSSGDIETDFPLQVTRHGRDHMTGRIGDGRGSIAIETGSGEIKLLKRSS